MRKALVVLAALCVLPSVAEAGGRYGSAGCGLGSMIIKSEGFLQVFAATTNTFLGTQTFGITSGTSNCTSAGIVQKDKERLAFAEAALPDILQDAAGGDGQYLEALGLLYGCSADGVDLFSQSIQGNLTTICDAESCDNGINFLTSLEGALATDAELAAACPQIVAM
jgi:hypothetical protein